MQNNERRTYSIGDISIGYEGPFFEEKEFLSKFRTENNTVYWNYQIIPKKDVAIPVFECVHCGTYIDIFQNKEETIRVIYGEQKNEIVLKDICKDGKNHFVEIFENWIGRYGTNLMMKLFDLPHQMIAQNGVFLHASYVIWKGKAILFTAPKQTGKSTQANLWEQFRGAKVVNGDRALIRKTEEGWMVYGSPYCGTSKICENISSPLGAIVILSQAKRNAAYVEKPLEAYKALLDGMTFRIWDAKEVSAVADMIKELILNIPIIRLECLPNEEAVKTLEDMLW